MASQMALHTSPGTNEVAPLPCIGDTIHHGEPLTVGWHSLLLKSLSSKIFFSSQVPSIVFNILFCITTSFPLSQFTLSTVNL